MKKIFPLIALAMPCAAMAQSLHNAGAALYITTGGSLQVAGHFVNASGTISNDGTLRLTGNLTNNAAMASAGTGTLTLAGTTFQTIAGSEDYLAENVIVNNPAGIGISRRLRVDGAMTFTSGLVSSSGTNPVHFTANGTVSGTPTNASHVYGQVVKEGTGAFTYPVGNATNYQPIAVNLSANSAGVSAAYYVGESGGVPYGTTGSSSIPLVAHNGREYWMMFPVGTATGTATVFFDGYNNVGITNTSHLRVARRGGPWSNEGAASVSGTIASGSVTSNSISDWGIFTLGSISPASPLPLSMLSFTAVPDGQMVRVDWRTATEKAGTRFVAERSADGREFLPLASRDGKGGSAAYTVWDEQPLAGKSFYRLQSVEADGQLDYGPTVIIHRYASGSSILALPVPATDVLVVAAADAAQHGTAASITDVQGRQVAQLILSARTEVDVRSWPVGIYLLRLPNGEVMRLEKK